MEFNPYKDYSNEELKAVQIYAASPAPKKKIPLQSKNSSVLKALVKDVTNEVD